MKRFTDWGNLDASVTGIAESIGYTKYSWNVMGENDIEQWRYSDLLPDEATAVDKLGISSDQWDCWINHYAGYWWADLETMGITSHLQVLGWNESMWDGDGSKPDTDYLYWYELSANQQAAAKQICYSEQLWDGVPLKKWQ
jgi:hypothetical protein